MDVLRISSTKLRELGLKASALGDVASSFDSLESTTDFTGQFAMMKNGKLVLSLWAGVEKATSRPIDQGTLFPVLSATKGIASMVVLHLYHLGYFDWNDSLCDHWPEFGKNGKQRATIADALSHRVGLPNLTAQWRHWTDRRYMTNLIEEASPEWEPGTAYGYHGGSWGVIVDELVRRWTGSQTGEVLHSLLPNIRDSCFIGLPSERYVDVAQLERVAPNEGYHSKAVLMSCQSSGGAVATAEGIACLHNLLARRGELDCRICWTEGEQVYATQPWSHAERELPRARPELAFSWGMGFMVPPSLQVFGSTAPSTRTAGHPGASGAIGWADPYSRLAVGMTTTGMDLRAMYRQFAAVGDALQDSLYSH